MEDDDGAGETTQRDLLRRHRRLLRSCAAGEAPASLGEALHASFLKSSTFSLLPSLRAALFHMYAAAASSPSPLLRSLRAVPPPLRGTAELTALASSLCRRHNLPAAALRAFRFARRTSLRLDAVSLLPPLAAAALLADPAAAAAAHVLFLKSGLPFTVTARNSLAHAYSSSGFFPAARRVLAEMEHPTVVSWTVLLAGALKCEGLESAVQVFDEMPLRNEVSWTIMIAAVVQSGRSRDALLLLREALFGDGAAPSAGFRCLNYVSCCSLLSACSESGDLAVGRWVHAHVAKSGGVGGGSVVLQTALIDMYGKCGRVASARRVFDSVPDPGVAAWNAMLSVLALHGFGGEALALFSRMTQDGRLRPDDITFVVVLSACCRCGLVEQGREIFGDITRVYGSAPAVEHYGCIVDLLGRAGLVEEAEAVARGMPMKANEVVLGSLIASAAIHQKAELGGEAMRRLLRADPDNTECHALFSNLYRYCGRQADGEALMRRLTERRRGGARKIPGWSTCYVSSQLINS